MLEKRAGENRAGAALKTGAAGGKGRWRRRRGRRLMKILASKAKISICCRYGSADEEGVKMKLKA